ncbi:MAG TPA: hypothetical protein PKA63_06345 [Oligoflexia bacterium]|nr:hypothetical protein [Oligoflexia bacterium]HMP48268.1 hypothetical protein [Oligoflexia bacterium]
MNNSFEEIFNIELTCWCFGISHTSETVDHKVLHRIIKEFSSVFRESIENLYQFDILKTSRTLIEAGKCNATEQEIAFYILSYLPTPCELTKEQNEILQKIVQQVEDAHGGAFDRVMKKWEASRQKFESHNPDKFLSQLDKLSIPSLRR